MDSALSVPSKVPAVPASDRRISRLGWVLIALAVAAYGVLLALHTGAHAGGSDSSGYMNHARLLGLGRVHVESRMLPELAQADTPSWLYSPLGFRPASGPDTLVPTYPAGLPLWVMVGSKIIGWAHGAHVVLCLHAMAGVLLTFALGRAFGLSQRAALIGAVVIGSSPVYLFMGLQVMSDVPALTWTTAAILAAWYSRQRAAWGLAAGACFAMAVLVRPTSALMLLPAGIALGISWRRWVAFGIGGIPGAVFFVLHSHAAYGHYLTTGYGGVDLESRWVGMTLLHYARWLPALFTPIVVAFLGLPAILREVPRQGAILLAWVLVLAGFYSAYNCTHETWWYLRFLLPAAPALVVGSLLVLQSILGRRLTYRMATLTVCIGLVAAVVWNTSWSRKYHVLDVAKGEEIYPLVAEWLRKNVPENAVIAAMQHSGAIFHYTDFTFVRWDSMDKETFAKFADATVRSKRPLYAALFPFEIEEEHALSERMPTGTWKQVGAVREVTIWQWTPTAETRAQG